MADDLRNTAHDQDDSRPLAADELPGRDVLPAFASATVRIGRNEIEISQYGYGEPTVVIVPGFGATAGEWHPVAALTAATTSIFMYERPPYGRSGPATDRRTASDIAAELAAVLDAAGVTGPLVLVGHSAGGRYVRRFAADHPDRVAGMVLVDSSHEAQQQRLAPVQSRRMRWRERLMPIQIMADRSRSVAVRRSMVREYRALTRQTVADLIPEGSLGAKPLVVLTRAHDSDPMMRPGWPVWFDLQVELARRSTNHRHTIAATDDHFIHVADPTLVAEAITDVVRAARTGTQLG